VLLLLEHILLRGALIGVRVAGVMTFAPFLSSTAYPVRVKAAFTLVCTALLYTVCPVPAGLLAPGEWTRIVFSEIVLSLAMGLCLQFIFESVQVAGQLAGFQLGFSLVNVIDPQTNVDTPVLSTFHQLFVLLLFLQLNVHHWILRGLVKSYDYVPVGSAHLTASFVKEFLHHAGAMWLVGVQIAAPLLFATVVIDVTVGFLSKASPQLPAILLSIPMKSLVGYIVFGVAVRIWPTLFEKQFALALGWSERLLHLAH
jgi:flagellar biosynthesis protein FliR